MSETLDLTYQAPSAGTDSAALEGYVVEDSAGEPAGKVVVLLDRGGELSVAVGLDPRDVRLVPVERVASVDHAALVLRLALTREELEQAPALDPGRAVESGEPADARRVTVLPRSLAPPPAPPSTTAEPLDSLSLIGTLAPGVAGLFALLCVVIVFTYREDAGWWFALVAIPAALFGLSIVMGYRLARRPYVRH